MGRLEKESLQKHLLKTPNDTRPSVEICDRCMKNGNYGLLREREAREDTPCFTPLRTSRLQTTPPSACRLARTLFSKASPTRATREIPVLSPTPALPSESPYHPADVSFTLIRCLFSCIVTYFLLFYLIAVLLTCFWCLFTGWWWFFVLLLLIKKRHQ